MSESYSAAKSSLSFAKLVATPTETAWSQVYNIGNVFVCLSLIVDKTEEELSLHSIGKDVFATLQSEFFSLETKDVEGIKRAVQTSIDAIPAEVSSSLTLAFFKDATLYVVIAGSGKVVMKRGENVGVLLHKHDSEESPITAVSGYLQNGDTLVLETGPFSADLPHEAIKEALSGTLPTDIVEALSPKVHEKDNGAHAAIVISYHGATQQTEETQEPQETQEDPTLAALYEADQPSLQENDVQEEEPQEISLSRNLPHVSLGQKFRLTHRQKLFLNIAFIILLLLGASIFLTMKKSRDDKQQALFQNIYPAAEQYYKTGQGLESLNPTLSQENYQKAEKLLQDGQTKIQKGSTEYQQIASLLTKVEDALQNGSNEQTVKTTQVEPEDNSLLAIEQANPQGVGFGADAYDIYYITDKAITAVSKNSGAKKAVIKNDKDWVSPKAVIPYQGNLYVLDQKKGVLKYASTGDGYGKSNYFSGSAPDLSKATGMAIDGAIWIVTSDGTVNSYTRGVSDNIKVTGLEKPLNKPSKIVTDIGMDNVYILDKGNSRIVQIDKHGAFQNEYHAPIIATASDFTVSEKDKKILVLSGGKVWQIEL